MAEEYEYQKQRKIFGRYPMFEDTDSKIVGSIPPQNKDSDYVLRDPNTLLIDNIPIMSEHKVSTHPNLRASDKFWPNPPVNSNKNNGSKILSSHLKINESDLDLEPWEQSESSLLPIQWLVNDSQPSLSC